MATNTTATTEEEKHKIRKALSDLFKAIIYNLTHSNKSMLAEKVEEMQEQLNESLAQQEINADSLEDIYEAVSELKGKIEATTPEKWEQAFNEASGKVDDILNNAVVEGDKSTFYKEVRKMLAYELDTPMPTDEEELRKELDKNTKLIDAGDKLYLEYKGVVLEAELEIIPDSESKYKLKIKGSELEHEDIFNEDGSLKEGFSPATSQTGNIQTDVNTILCEKNGLTYFTDTEQLKESALQQMSGLGVFAAGRTGKIAVSDDKTTESHYSTSDGTFRVRDTETGDTLRIQATKDKIEIFLHKETDSIKDCYGTGTKLGEIASGENRIKASFTYKDQTASKLIHNPETRKFLEFNGISEKQQNGLFVTKDDTTWEKVSQNQLDKVYALKDACLKAAEQRSDSYAVSVRHSPKSDFTFVVLTQQNENNDSKNQPQLAFAFDKEGNAKVVNYLDENTNGKWRFIQNIRTNNISHTFYESSKNYQFAKMYNIACDAMKEMGIDIQKSYLTEYNEKSAKFDIQKENASELRFAIAERDKTVDKFFLTPESKEEAIEYAKDVNKAAMFAIKNREIKTANLKELGITRDAKSVFEQLEKLGVVKSGLKSHKATMTEFTYEQLVIKLALKPDERNQIYGYSDSFSAFLVDACKQEKFEEVSRQIVNSDNLAFHATILAEIVKENNGAIGVSKAQNLTGKTYKESKDALKELVAMDVMQKNAGSHTYDFQMNELEARILFMGAVNEMSSNDMEIPAVVKEVRDMLIAEHNDLNKKENLEHINQRDIEIINPDVKELPENKSGRQAVIDTTFVDNEEKGIQRGDLKEELLNNLNEQPAIEDKNKNKSEKKGYEH